MLSQFSLHARLENKGYTLVEVLIAMVILSIGFLGLSVITMTMIKGLSFSQRLTTAITLAQDKIEEIKQTGYYNVISANYPMEDYTMIPSYPEFQRTVAIANDIPNVKTVTVTVSWKQDMSGGSQQVSFTTMISR
jgi:type IV pilus assembly protein PilV